VCHQHFSDDQNDECIVLIMKAKPLFLFMHMIFQKVVSYPPKEPSWAMKTTRRRRSCDAQPKPNI